MSRKPAWLVPRCLYCDGVLRTVLRYCAERGYLALWKCKKCRKEQVL